MQEIFDQLVGYLKGVWNKRWYGMFITWIICVIGWVFVYQMPDEFESKAKIYIDTQSLLKPLLRGLTVNTNTAQEINLMVRTLLTKPNVEKMIRLSDLDLSVNNTTEYDALVKELQSNIKFIKPSRSKVNIYHLAYTNTKPEIAQNVLQSVITVFVENSIGQNKSDSSTAKVFIEKQIKEYEIRLTEAENRLKVFKQKNVGQLPSSKGGYYARMEQSKSAIEQTQLELDESERAKIALLKDLDKMIYSIKKSFSMDNNNLVKTSYDARIEKLQITLDELLLRYTVNHPDIKGIKLILSDLEDKKTVELKIMKKATVTGDSGLELNPVYQDLKIKLGTLNIKISSLKVRLAEYKKRHKKLSSLVNRIPEIEAQLTSLNRDYDITKKKYGELLERRETATLSANINKTSDGIQFNVLEKPSISRLPVGPNRILFSSMIFLLSIATGIAFAFVLSQVKPVFNSTLELERIAGLPILGTVSAVSSQWQNRRRSMLVLFYLSLFLVLFLIYAALIAWYMQGFWNMVNNVLEML